LEDGFGDLIALLGWFNKPAEIPELLPSAAPALPRAY
jgi:hypothetical protein